MSSGYKEESRMEEIRERERRKKKIKIAIGSLIIIIFLIFSLSAIGNFLNPLRLVSEVTAQPEQYLNRDVQIVGFILTDTWQQIGPKHYAFKLSDGNSTINVELFGDPPGTLRPEAKVTVIGKLVAPDKVVSNQILIQCPSKYEAVLEEGIEKTRKNA